MKRKPNFRILFRTAFTAIDAAVFSFICTLATGLLFHAHRRTVFLVTVFVCVFASSLFLHIRMFALKKKIQIKREEERFRQEKLFLMSDREIADAIGTASFYLIRKADPDLFDILEAIRSGASVICAAKKTAESEACIMRNAPDVVFMDSGELIRRISGTESTQDPESKVFSGLLNRVNKYFALGCILFFFSFVVNFKIYFRMISCICLIIAPFSGFFQDVNRHWKLRIFLDKEADR